MFRLSITSMILYNKAPVFLHFYLNNCISGKLKKWGNSNDSENDEVISDSGIRREDAGRKPITEICPNITETIEKIIDVSTYGDPSRELNWVASTLGFRKIRDILEEDYSITASHEKISQLLAEMGYSK